MPAPPASTASGALGPLHNKTRGFCPPKGSRTPLPPTAQPQAPALPTQEDKDLRGLACLSWPHTSSSSAIPPRACLNSCLLMPHQITFNHSANDLCKASRTEYALGNMKVSF